MLVLQAILYVPISVVVGDCCPTSICPIQRFTTISVSSASDGSWKRIHDHLVGWVRVDANRNSTPTVGSLDSQTVLTDGMVHQAVGYDSGKKIKGRKRFTLVDTLGLLIAVRFDATSVPNSELES
jgi:putative transposase